MDATSQETVFVAGPLVVAGTLAMLSPLATAIATAAIPLLLAEATTRALHLTSDPSSRVEFGCA